MAGASCSGFSRSPGIERNGDGTVTRILWVRFPPQFVSRWLVPDDERCIVGFTAGGGEWRGPCQATSYTTDGEVIATRDLYVTKSAAADRSDRAVVTDMLRVHVLELPGLGDAEPTIGVGPLFQTLRIARATDTRGGWIAFRSEPWTDDSRLLRVDADPLRVSEGPVVGFPRPHAFACVPGSGDVVAVTDEEAAVIDPTTGDVRRRTALPCGKAGFDVALTAERAWISSYDEDGSFVELSLTTEEAPVLRRTGASGRTSLAIDSSRRFVGVVVWEPRPRNDGRAVCAILHEVGSDGLREVGRTTYESQSMVGDVAVIGSRRAVAIAGYPGDARIIEFPARPDAASAPTATSR